ncbi:MAG: hypothetical protein PHR06_05040 [Candidatus Cloacimonetes bacterium]|nr:hypothetical protein [Candidatus Cloacimonadota bacterium]
MDTSKRYISMCKKALEMQQYWKPQNGDYFYGRPYDIDEEDVPPGINIYFECEDEYYCVIPRNYSIKEGFKGESDAVFLPRLDNLYKMVLHDTPYELMERFCKWSAKLTITMQERYQTLEQLWMAFVMETNHGLLWSGKDWVLKENK